LLEKRLSLVSCLNLRSGSENSNMGRKINIFVLTLAIQVVGTK
jgi:hypothetical protein